ncbi:MAG: double-strand break repair helicase AddA [Xanthobacteraceae bacterium]
MTTPSPRSPGVIPADVLRLQSEVSNPGISAWVAANAGSGKTHVLARRVINLLLAGVDPEKILCLTFTKAAAANMAKRVFDTLGRWTTLGDDALDAAIGEHPGRAPAARRLLARRLFARALDTPGGLKVQTIHAFCTRLLHQFPFEANVTARFSVLDDTEQSQLLEHLTLDALLEGASAPDGPLGRALGAAMIAGADQTFRDVVREAIGRRDAFIRWRTNAGSVEQAIAELSRTLGVELQETLESVEVEFLSASLIAPTEWPAIAAALARGSKNDCEQARRFATLAALSGANRLEVYLEIFCTDEGTPRKSIVTKAIKDAGLLQRLSAEQARVGALLERRNAVVARDRSGAVLTVADAVLTRYGAEKSRRGLLDYDDLIDKTLALLDNVDAAWVHYKLDLGVDHVLIDEAQDTSHKQWEIVRRLVAEFTAGKGARDLKRTIFAVGDEKQSIFSFQDAAPKQFAEMRRHFERAHKDAGLDFVFREFKHSFRSGESVLAAVDQVFKAPDIAVSVSSDADGFPPHIPLPDARPSLVEIWEPETPDARDETKEGWDAPFDAVTETSPRVKLARRIARTVRRLTDSRMPVGIERRAVRYGDVLVLVRQRGPLFEAIIRALKDEKVEVAGADRLMLTEHIAVMDLMALAEALLLPQDDLALASVLRSPLFGFTDDDLFAIAWDRGRSSLRTALVRKAGEQQIFAGTAARLDELTQATRCETPFSFYARVLGAGGGRRRFLARLGAEANDALDEFLNLALDYERRETPTLQGFLAWLRDARAEVKRDMEIARDEVRVMTVHGAKGLEAPIVILADTMTPPVGPRPPRLIDLPSGAVIWAGRKDDDVPPVAAARQIALAKAADEYRRLLYVAMTRAADRLIVGGADGVNRRPQGCWYNLVHDALVPMLVVEGENDEKVLRFSKHLDEKPGARTEAATETVAADTGEAPWWLREAAPAEAKRPTRISPSSAFDEEIAHVAQTGSAADRQKALARGRIVHRLMQSLPDIPAAARKSAIDRFLRSAAADFLPAEQAEMGQQVLTILNDLVFAELFAEGSRAEVPIVGRIACDGGAPIEVSGQVDRLAVTRDAVLIADYKTDRAVPLGLAEAPQAYIGQLALYRAVLARIYPAKTIRAALIFTAGPNVIEVPGPAMEAALAEIMRKNQPNHAPAHAPVRRS